jgi:hypothetical protein
MQPKRKRNDILQTCGTGKLGIPVLAGIYGTNLPVEDTRELAPHPLAHKNCNIAVGGGGIVSGMSPKVALMKKGRAYY